MNLNKRKEKLQKDKILWQKEKQIIQQEQKILQQKQELQPKKKFLSTSKLIILFLFINCTLLEIFTCYVTLENIRIAQTIGSVDFTPLVTLISTVVGEVISFAIYSAKASKENTKGGIVYDSAMKDLDQYWKEQDEETDEQNQDNQDTKG